VGLKVAIVGFSPSRDQAPWSDPEWCLWGLAWDPERARFGRTFEMHELSMLDAKQIDALQDCEGLYMQEGYEQVPNATAYPFEAVARTTGAYWCSSLAYALALAIHEEAEEIGIWGVDGQEQYAYQHPNLNFLIGLAMGKGIKVTLPETCPLLKFVSDPDFDYAGRYGRLNGANH
jgi:hypothetical protein